MIKMYAHIHLLVVGFGILGLFISGFLTDLDHTNTLKAKWNCFTHADEKNCQDANINRGFMHNKTVFFCIIAFMMCFVIGYVIHIAMDYGVFQ